MVDLEKLSEMVESEQRSSSSGINPLEAIKMLTDLIKTAKEVQQQQQGLQQNPTASQPVITTPQPEPKPKPEPKPEPKQEQKPVITEEQKSQAFDKIIQGLEMGLNLFGKDISAKDYIEQLKKHKDEIIKAIKL